jgi:hypothetical protein
MRNKVFQKCGNVGTWHFKAERDETQGGEPIDKKRERDRGREGGQEGEGAGGDTSRRA